MADIDLEETICFCGNVTAGDIKAAVDAGNTTLEAVQEATGAGTHCGGCVAEERLQNLLKQLI